MRIAPSPDARQLFAGKPITALITREVAIWGDVIAKQNLKTKKLTRICLRLVSAWGRPIHPRFNVALDHEMPRPREFLVAVLPPKAAAALANRRVR